jgi:hypothetical protein
MIGFGHVPAFGDQVARNLAGAIQVRTVTVDEANLTGTSAEVNVGAALPENAWVLGHQIVCNEQGAGQSDLTIKIGGTDDDAIVASTDLDAMTVGARSGTAGACPVGFFSEQQLVATFAATALASLTAGNWTINVVFVVVS